jgi:HAE1 family hydrophobic/amphiphilic exporter-1
MLLRGEESRPRQLDFLHIRPLSRAFAAFIHGADAAVSWLSRTYGKVIHVALNVRYLLLLVFFAGLAATVWMYQRVPTGFIPQEDQGYLLVIVQAPPGSSLAYTGALSDRAEAIIASNPDIIGSFAIMGFGFSGSAANQGLMFVSTKPSNQRRGKGHSAADIVADLSPKLSSLLFAQNGGLVAMFEPPAVNGVGSFGGFQFELQDRQHHYRPRQNCPQDCEQQPRQQGSEGSHHDIFRQRSPGTGHHRSRESQDNEYSALPDHQHPGRLHGIGIYQRLRLQQPHLSGFCTG